MPGPSIQSERNLNPFFTDQGQQTLVFLIIQIIIIVQNSRFDRLGPLQTVLDKGVQVKINNPRRFHDFIGTLGAAIHRDTLAQLLQQGHLAAQKPNRACLVIGDQGTDRGGIIAERIQPLLQFLPRNRCTIDDRPDNDANQTHHILGVLITQGHKDRAVHIAQIGLPIRFRIFPAKHRQNFQKGTL